jgi:hypothetical protein
MSRPVPFTPPHVSVNRVQIVDLPGIAIDPQVRGRKAYELLSSRAIVGYARERASELELPADYCQDSVRTRVELAHFVDDCLQSPRTLVREAARAIGRRLGRNLGHILATLHRGDQVNRDARSDWTTADWERWHSIEKIWLGGGLMSGRLGALILQGAGGFLDECGLAGRIRLAPTSYGGEIALFGAARYLPSGSRQSLCLDLGQTLVKRACLRFEDEALDRVERFSPLPVDWDRLGVPSHPDPRRGRWVLDFVASAIVQTWEESVSRGCSPGEDIMLSVAAYVQNGRLLGNGIYAQMHAVAEDIRPFLVDLVSARVGVRIRVQFIHDGTAAATLYAGERNTAVMLVGTALGIGFPPVDSDGLRPVTLNPPRVS